MVEGGERSNNSDSESDDNITTSTPVSTSHRNKRKHIASEDCEQTHPPELTSTPSKTSRKHIASEDCEQTHLPELTSTPSKTSRKHIAGIDCKLFSAIEECLNNVINPKIDVNLDSKLLLTLIKLKLNLSCRVLSVFFITSEPTAKAYFHEMVPILKDALKTAIYWPSVEKNLKNMPACFAKYKKTRIILDCTEIAAERAKCLKCRTQSYSYYKSIHTVKYLIGITPATTISYISPGYGGRISNKAICNNENLISLLEPYFDEVMVDKGFAIEEQPPLLRKQSQFSKHDPETTAEIVRTRVHVERAIRRMKTFKILCEHISCHLLSYIDGGEIQKYYNSRDKKLTL
ncbi:hypothetical protein RI129_002926 [Pyrocoelia pectoralis]|uniref:DDE Tnp4 domain-containing protein n=1 Tax=Pyrocoelia pectoralis TaxID=417401 RepID=A0AAN7VQN1_9COLE